MLGLYLQIHCDLFSQFLSKILGWLFYIWLPLTDKNPLSPLSFEVSFFGPPGRRYGTKPSEKVILKWYLRGTYSKNNPTESNVGSISLTQSSTYWLNPSVTTYYLPCCSFNSSTRAMNSLILRSPSDCQVFQPCAALCQLIHPSDDFLDTQISFWLSNLPAVCCPLSTHPPERWLPWYSDLLLIVKSSSRVLPFVNSSTRAKNSLILRSPSDCQVFQSCAALCQLIHPSDEFLDTQISFWLSSLPAVCCPLSTHPPERWIPWYSDLLLIVKSSSRVLLFVNSSTRAMTSLIFRSPSDCHDSPAVCCPFQPLSPVQLSYLWDLASDKLIS